MGVYLLKPVHNAHCLKMSPGCTIETSDESELLASKLTPPTFLYIHEDYGPDNVCQVELLSDKTRWALRSQGTFHFLKEITTLMGRKLILWFTFFLLVRLLP